METRVWKCSIVWRDRRIHLGTQVLEPWREDPCERCSLCEQRTIKCHPLVQISDKKTVTAHVSLTINVRKKFPHEDFKVLSLHYVLVWGLSFPNSWGINTPWEHIYEWNSARANQTQMRLVFLGGSSLTQGTNGFCRKYHTTFKEA